MTAVLTLHSTRRSCGPCAGCVEIKTVAEGLGGADVVGLGWGSAENFMPPFFFFFFEDLLIFFLPALGLCGCSRAVSSCVAGGFSRWRPPLLGLRGSVVAAPWPGCPEACGLLLAQGLNPCLLHW